MVNEFEKGEIIVLKKEFDDTNAIRTYRVLESNDDQVTVAISTFQDRVTREFIPVNEDVPVGTFENYIFEKYL